MLVAFLVWYVIKAKVWSVSGNNLKDVSLCRKGWAWGQWEAIIMHLRDAFVARKTWPQAYQTVKRVVVSLSPYCLWINICRYYHGTCKNILV